MLARTPIIMPTMTESKKDVLSRFFGSQTEELLVQHCLREIAVGRHLTDILADPYLKNRSTDLERRALLDHREIIDAVGEETLADLRRQLGDL